MDIRFLVMQFASVVSLCILAARALSAAPAGCLPKSNGTHINCRSSSLELMPDIGDTVIYLDLSLNKLTEVKTLPFSNLISLNFSSNSISFIEDHAFGELRNLVTLDLSYNLLSGGNITANTFSGLQKLEQVYLQGNPIRLIPDSTFHVLQHFRLKFVDFSFCQIARIEKDALADVGTLETLLLHGNFLTESDLVLFDGISWLEVLDLSKNPINRITDRHLYPLFHLERLYLDACGLRTIGDEAFRGLDHLRVLSLSNNSLETINIESLRLLDKLEELVLSGNPIQSVDSTTFSIIRWPLKTLRLENMPVLDSIKKDSFQTLEFLEILSITNNKKLTKLESESLFTPYGNLKWVNLDNNSLTNLPSTLLDWENVRRVTLFGNPWYCDCKMRWAVKGAMNKTSPIICQGPAERQGSDLLKLSANQLSCLSRATKIGLSVTLAVGLCILVGLSAFFIIRWRRSSRYSAKDIMCFVCIRGKEERYVSVYQNDDIEPFAKITFSEEEESLKAAVDV